VEIIQDAMVCPVCCGIFLFMLQRHWITKQNSVRPTSRQWIVVDVDKYGSRRLREVLPDLFLWLEQIDAWIFYAINHGMQNPVFDAVMPVITNTTYWRPIYALALILLAWKGGRTGRICALTLIVTVAVLDPLSTHLLKETIGRLRPYDVLGDVHRLINSGSGSFPSNHALNNSAAAMVLGYFYPRLTWLWWTIAITIAYSRIYCGVHWPSDVLGGIGIGALAGWGIVSLLKITPGINDARHHHARHQ
jgi:undecaprenyl-diphosphatase